MCAKAKYWNARRHIHQWTVNCTSCSPLSHLKRPGFVCPKVLRSHGLVWESSTGSFPFRNPGTAFICFTCMVGISEVQDRQKLYGFLCCSSLLGFYSQDLPNFDYLCHQADNSMFTKVLHNSEHVLHSLLPPFLTPCTISENMHMTEYCLIIFLV